MKQVILSIALLLALVLTPTAKAAGRWQKQQFDFKFPTQQLVENQSWAAPAAASATLYVNAGALTNGAATTFSNLPSPDYARNVVLTPGGTTASVGAGTATITGTNIAGKIITEQLSISAAQSTASTGAKAFRTITSVVFPASTGSGATLSIGTGSKLGLRRCVADAGNYAWSSFGGVYDSTRGTIAVDPANMEGNTFTSQSALNASSNVQLFYVQNYGCY